MFSSMSCSKVPSSLGTCETHPRMEIGLYRYNRTAGNVGEVMTAINGTLRLQSDSEVGCLNAVFSTYIYHLHFRSWLATHAQHASGRPSHVSDQSPLFMNHRLNGCISS